MLQKYMLDYLGQPRLSSFPICVALGLIKINFVPHMAFFKEKNIFECFFVHKFLNIFKQKKCGSSDALMKIYIPIKGDLSKTTQHSLNTNRPIHLCK